MWEEIERGTSRMKVPDGWIVKDERYAGVGCSTAMIFIEDKSYSWILPN